MSTQMPEPSEEQQQGVQVGADFLIGSLRNKVSELMNQIVMLEAFANQQQAQIQTQAEMIELLKKETEGGTTQDGNEEGQPIRSVEGHEGPPAKRAAGGGQRR